MGDLVGVGLRGAVGGEQLVGQHPDIGYITASRGTEPDVDASSLDGSRASVAAATLGQAPCDPETRAVASCRSGPFRHTAPASQD